MPHRIKMDQMAAFLQWAESQDVPPLAPAELHHVIDGAIAGTITMTARERQWLITLVVAVNAAAGARVDLAILRAVETALSATPSLAIVVLRNALVELRTAGEDLMADRGADDITEAAVRWRVASAHALALLAAPTESDTVQ